MEFCAKAQENLVRNLVLNLQEILYLLPKKINLK